MARYIFHEDCPEDTRIEIAERVALSLSPNGDPAGNVLVLQMVLDISEFELEDYDGGDIPGLAKWLENHHQLVDGARLERWLAAKTGSDR